MLKHNGDIDIAVANTAKATRWQNKRTTWADIVETFKETERTSETIEQYFKYSKDKQSSIKDVGGFVGGYLREGRRKKGYVEHRQLVTLDADYGTLDIWEAFTMLDIAGVMYTTHKHTSESPRFRIVFPLDRKVTPEEYEAVARVVASWLGIDNFDDTTYQHTRLMYYPSTSKDGEYLFDFIDAPWLSADNVLAELPNWQDPTTWPVSSRAKEVVKTNFADKVEDPYEKEGIVGAFCRAFLMYDVISEFLNEVYTPCEELGADRYSYIGGSTSGGLVIYDNKFAYSHHSTDIACGKLCNAFDLVRLHKFADLDEKSKTKDVTRLPSYKAMADFASKLKEVKREIIYNRRNDYKHIEEKARDVAESDDWIEELETEKNGTVKNTINNVVLILNNDNALKGRLRLNLLSMWDEVSRPFYWDKDVYKYPRPSTDNDINQIRMYLEKNYGINKAELVTTAMAIVSNDNSHHPLKEYLDALPKWDKIERLERLLINLFGAEDTPYTRAVTAKTFCAAVKRIYQPGIKFDHMLVLIGTGGNGKSTFLSKIGGNWFTDNVKLTSDDKQNLAIMRGKWILEIAEMTGFNKKEAEFTKQFLSRTEDIYKRPYDRKEIVFPRQSIFIGTHNKSEFLHDETGNRRYWPVQTTTGKKDAAKVWRYLTRDTVDQLWAEAKERDEPLYLNMNIEKQAEEIQRRHLESDSWEADIFRFVADKNEVTTKEIWDLALLGSHPITKVEQNRIAKIMRASGEWEYKGVRRKGIRFKVWSKEK